MTTKGHGAGSRFSVIIVNYNGGELLKECVQSAMQEGVPAPQIIIVDNHSQDRSVEDLRQTHADLVVIQNSCNAGFSRAVNQGLRRTATELSQIDFVLLLNNDAQLDSGALQSFADQFDALPNLAIAGGQLRYPDGRLQSAFAPLPTVLEDALPLSVLKFLYPTRFRRKTFDRALMAVECVFGACLCVRNSFLPQLGVLDEDYFFFFEEIEWCQRARQMGREVYYVPGARALHRGGHTANRFHGASRVEYQRSKLTFYRKTRPFAAYLAVSAALVLRALINALAAVITCTATLFLNRRLRQKAATYWYLLGWHSLLRPAGWGLPGKCPVIKIFAGGNSDERA